MTNETYPEAIQSFLDSEGIDWESFEEMSVEEQVKTIAPFFDKRGVNITGLTGKELIETGFNRYQRMINNPT